jgi:hypothetical protein
MSESYSIEELLFELSKEWFKKNGGYKSERATGVFSAAVTIWLMMVQRLNACSLRATLEKLSNNPGSIFVKANATSKRLKESKFPQGSGGLAKARQRLSVSSLWELFREINRRICGSEEENIFLLDGFVITAAHSLKNVEQFGQHKNAKGHAHYPKVQLVTAHALSSGKALCPRIGTIKENELRVSFPLFSEVKESALFIADRGFGVFAVAHAAQKNNHTVLLRLTDKRCKALGKLPQSGERIPCVWSASAETKRSFPELKEAESVKGEIFACTHATDRNKLLYFFTTSSLSTEKLCELYARRLQIETYIRHLKQTLALNFVTSKSPEMVEKEIAVAFTAFNLLCDIINRSATALKIPPQRISFSSLLNLIQVQEPAFLTAQSPEETKRLIERFLSYLNASKIPIRSKTRSYPRVLLRAKSKYPHISHEKLFALGK